MTCGQSANVFGPAALHFRTEVELPVYQRLGAVRDTLVCRARVALTLLARAAEAPAPEDLARANALLCQGLADARWLRIPDAEQIEAILREVGMECGAMPTG